MPEEFTEEYISEDIEIGENEEEENDGETAETIDYSQLLNEIITNQESIITETEETQNILNYVNTGILHLFYVNGMLVVIILLVIVSRYILRLF